MTVSQRSLPVLAADDVVARFTDAALTPAGEVLGVLLEPAGRHRHRSRAHGDPVRRPHGASRPRHLRYGGTGRREDLRPRSAPRSLSAFCRTVQASAPRLARGDARHHREDDGRQRPARRLDPLLAVVGTGQPRAHSGRRRRAGLLRDGFRRPLVSRSGGTRRVCG